MRVLRQPWFIAAALALATGVTAAPASAARSGPAAPAAATGGYSCPAPAKGRVTCAATVRPDSRAVRAAAARAATSAAASAATAPTGFSPLNLRDAYGDTFTALTGGVGQTVAVVTPYDDATAESDLGTYRSEYSIPACTTANGCFSKVNQTGGTTYPAAGPLGWTAGVAESLDMISAICPNCHLLLVEASSTGISDLGQAENEAVTLGADFVTNTWFALESTYGTSEPGYDTSYFDHPGVVITAPDGSGSGYGTYYPAASPDVVAVGGTTLSTSSGTARGWTETVFNGTGSGCSPYEAKPSWQTDTGCSTRMLNDTAAVADPSTPPAFYDTTSGGWSAAAGGDVPSAIVAAAYALGGTPAAGSNPPSYLYAHTGQLNDITSGSNGTCSITYYCTAGTGYDGPSGLGSPDGAVGPAAPTASLPGGLTVYNPVKGDLEVYATTSGNALQMDAWSSGSGWAGWQNLGGSIAGRPVAIYNPASGNLEVYARGTGGTLEEDYWNSANGWSGWSSLGGSVAGNPAAVYDPSTGDLEVFATGSGSTLEEDYWNPASGWSGWSSLGGTLTGSPSAVWDPAASHIEVYAVNSSGALWEAYHTTSWKTQSLGGSLSGSPAAVWDVVNDSLDVYTTGSSGVLDEDSWASGTGWSGSTSRGGSITGSPTAVYNPGSGNLEVYAEGTGGTLEEIYDSPAHWSSWNSLGGSLTGGPVAIYDPANGDLEVYAISSAGLWEAYWASGKGWSTNTIGGSLNTL